jgi:hypothetical protein
MGVWRRLGWGIVGREGVKEGRRPGRGWGEQGKWVRGKKIRTVYFFLISLRCFFLLMSASIKSIFKVKNISSENYFDEF